MGSPAESASALMKVRWPLALAVALLASACTTSGAPRPARLEIQETGFTLSEEVRVAADVRADFAAAVRLLEHEQWESGIAQLLEVAEAAPQLTAAHIDLAIAYRARNDLARAEASLVRALELQPRHPVALNELGILYRRTGRFEQARASYLKALAVYPGFHFARRNLAILCDLYLADAACALEHYELYVQAVPNDAEVAIWIADLRTRVGR